MKKTRSAGGIMCVLTALVLAGCGGGPAIRIRTDRLITRPPGDQPVIVKNFSTADTVIPGRKADQARTPDTQRAQVMDAINAALVGGLRSAGFNVMAFIEGATAPDSALIVDGVVSEIGSESDSVSVRATVRLYMAGSPGDVLSEFDVTNSGKGPGGWVDLAKLASGNIAKAIVNDYFLKKPVEGQVK